jgi:VWFA-related protein
MRYLICFLLALPLTVPAQAPEQAPETTLRATASEVLLDVVVRDKKAHIIRDLRPEEVQVFEDGVPQKVRHFEFFEGGSTPQAAPPPTPAPSTAAAAPVSATPTPPNVQELRDMSVVSVVVANLDPRGRKLTLDTMHDFIKNELRPNTYVGVFTLGMEGLRKVQMYTNDAEKISSAMDRAVNYVFLARPTAAAKGTQSSTEEDTVPVPDAAPAMGSPTAANAAQAGIAATIEQLTQAGWVAEQYDVYQGSMRYLSHLRALVQAQAEIPGRKVVLLFSAGLTVHADTVEVLRNVISTANRSNVSVYAVDTRGYTGQSDMDNSRRMLAAAARASMQQQMSVANGGNQAVTPLEVMSPQLAQASIHSNTRGNLAELAEGTGGVLLPASLDLRDPLRRAMEDVRTHYELSYSPTKTETDGSFRKIEVKVTRPGVAVFARNGYYALPLLNGRQIYPFEMATMKAINARPLLKQFDFYASALQFRPAPDRTQLAFVFEAPSRGLSITKDKEWAKVHVCVTGLIKNDQGQVIEKISKDIPFQVPVSKTDELQHGVVSFTAPLMLPPGRYTLETAAVDRESMKASVRRSMLVVGQGSGFSMSDVSVVRRVDAIQGPPNASDPLQARGGKVVPELSDSIPREAGGQVQFYAVGYPPAPVDAPIEVSIELWRDGQLVLQTPASAVPPDANGGAPILAGVPLEKLPSGQYDAQVSFQYKGQKVTRATAFTIGSGS